MNHQDKNYMNDLIKKCPYCAEEIKFEAIKCKFCGEILDNELRIKRNNTNKQYQNKTQKWSPGIAALLSFIIPGAGQMYKGNVLSGLLWFFFVLFGYFLFIIPGLILHLICIITATTGDPYE